ncbi:hypothetical protein FTX61_14935 [Nitriliruptoraceae bacterium ZYF776]|nr:hypothetical protein [Profundirhabdus halotolerans]
MFVSGRNNMCARRDERCAPLRGRRGSSGVAPGARTGEEAIPMPEPTARDGGGVISTEARRRPFAVALALALVASLLTIAPQGVSPAEAQDFPEDCPWMDTSLSADERAQLVIDASTLGQQMRWLVEHPAIQPHNSTFAGVEFEEALPCLPDIQFTDGPEGVHRAPGVTAFPPPIAEASIWSEDLTTRKYDVLSTEGWENRRGVFLAPGLSGWRTPLAARGASYLGEDPVLGGVLAAAGIRSMQQADDTPTIATLKHWLANEQRFGESRGSSNMDDRTFRQIYNLSYEIAIREGEPHSIMCSYNMINGVYACENDLQIEVLKEEFGWDGFIMSDFNGVYSTVPSLNGGMDMELNRPVYYTPELLNAALEAGEITEERIEDAAFRVVRSFIAAGLFDVPRPATANPEASTPEHKDLAQEMAEKGSILLKNDGVLPLEEGPSVAVIGPTATMGGTVNATTTCTLFGQIQCPNPVTPLEAIQARVDAHGGRVLYDDGSDIGSALAAVDETDIAIVFGYETTTYRLDREDLTLDGNSDELIAAVAAESDETIVVLQVGTAVEMPWLDDVDAVLNTWYPGERGGAALEGLLFGDVNPSGKLPITFPHSVDDTPTGGWDERVEQFPGVEDEDGILQTDYDEGLEVGYRWYQAQGIEPMFAFGHGLSYTTFDYANLEVDQTAAGLDISFQVTNSGDRVGDEIAQVYVQLPDEADESWKRLIAWDRIEDLEPGETADVQISLTADQLATRHLLEYWDEEADAWVTPEGEFVFYAGRSSEDLPLTTDEEANTPPTVADLNLTTAQDTPVEGQLEASDPDGDELTFTFGEPSNGTVTPGEDGTFTFTPAPGFTGEDTFEVTVTDGRGGSATATVTVTVTPDGEEPPVDGTLECPDGTGSGFPDVPAASPHADTVRCGDELGLFQGKADGRFDPRGSLTRGQVASVLDRIATAIGRPIDGPGRGFADVSTANVHADAITRLAGAGVIAGYGDGTFRPQDAIGRDQLASLVIRFVETTTGDELPLGASFVDVPSSSPHADALRKARGAGIVIGDEQGRADPRTEIRRDQAASLFVRSLAHLPVAD